MSDKENLSLLIDLILKWWEEHQYDTFSLSDGAEDNVYSYDPDFVVLAKQMTDKENIYLCCFQVVDSSSSKTVSSGDFSFTLGSSPWPIAREELVSAIKKDFIEKEVWSDLYFVQILSICKL